MRVVLDTNQHIRAIIQPIEKPNQILQFWHLGMIELAISPAMLEEFRRVARRPRIQQKYNLLNTDIDEYLEVLREFAIVVHGSITLNVVPDDPDDNMIIACALEAKADVIVSGDRHLLVLGSYQGIPIVKASDFLSKYTPL